MDPSTKEHNQSGKEPQSYPSSAYMDHHNYDPTGVDPEGGIF